MDKYFTPEIEDIRVGYECEQQSFVTYDAGTRSERQVESWVPTVVQHIHNHQHPKIKNPVYRVPYLTKEQIEAEGWEKDNIPNSAALRKGRNKLTLATHSDERRVLVIKLEMPHDEWITIFYGECKDINTFRYICKLLSIN